MNDETRVYASVSTGYRSGGYTPRASTAEGFQSGFDEETVTSYELGVKSDLLDNRIRFNSSIFHIDFEDQQVASFEAGTGGATSVIFNAGKSTISGIEVELTAQLTEALRLNLNVGHIDSEYDEFISGRTDPVSGFPSPTLTSPSYNAATGEEDISDLSLIHI